MTECPHVWVYVCMCAPVYLCSRNAFVDLSDLVQKQMLKITFDFDFDHNVRSEV